MKTKDEVQNKWLAFGDTEKTEMVAILFHKWVNIQYAEVRAGRYRLRSDLNRSTELRTVVWLYLEFKRQNEPEVKLKHCPECGTKNYNFSSKTGSFCCAFC